MKMDFLRLLCLLLALCLVHAKGGQSRAVDSRFNGIDSDKLDVEEIGISKLPPKSRKEKEQLYEAYNMLHSLAQDFHKPFDAPAVIVVGHQTSGKSALIEALMGFQFNQVGGGTKTRRPIALRMQYNPKCSTPSCYLTLENGKEEQRSLTDIQSYIEAENKRLERDPTRCFDSREINIRMEYRYCPNMIVIDTPGMLHPPKGKQLTPQQRALQQAAREAEALVLSKIKCQDYIILCVEDTTDWKHATTRNVVMQADPELTRTVLVTTKLDTKLPQFSEAEDLEDFLRAPLIKKIFPHILGGPFFTTVPCGRVGKDLSDNDDFVQSLKLCENDDRKFITTKMGHVQSRTSLVNVGVTRLRSFLETRVEETYRRNVAKIVPLLQGELHHTENKLAAIETELAALSTERLKHRANVYREMFSKELANAIHGSIKSSPEEYGETLESEQLRGGSFLDQDQLQTDSWQRLIELEVGNGKHKLYGGAQYHRAIREFTVAARHMRSPVITEDEIANAAGMGDVHDGVNFMRAACVIAVEKAQNSFEPLIEALKHRTIHIMRRLFPVVENAIRKSGTLGNDGINPHLSALIRNIYDKFIDSYMEECLKKCRDDLKGMTKFVTWDVDGKGGSSALYRSLPTPNRMVEIYSVAVDTQAQKGTNSDSRSVVKSGYDDNAEGQLADYYDLLQLTEEMLAGRNANRTSTVVAALVQYIIRSWREHFARTVSMKFNCFFLMPFMDDFPVYLRNELDQIYDSGNAMEMFDIAEARSVLQNKRNELLAEAEANSKLQKKFDMINSQLQNNNKSPATTRTGSHNQSASEDTDQTVDI